MLQTASKKHTCDAALRQGIHDQDVTALSHMRILPLSPDINAETPTADLPAVLSAACHCAENSDADECFAGVAEM